MESDAAADTAEVSRSSAPGRPILQELQRAFPRGGVRGSAPVSARRCVTRWRLPSGRFWQEQGSERFRGEHPVHRSEVAAVVEPADPARPPVVFAEAVGRRIGPLEARPSRRRGGGGRRSCPGGSAGRPEHRPVQPAAHHVEALVAAVRQRGGVDCRGARRGQQQRPASPSCPPAVAPGRAARSRPRRCSRSTRIGASREPPRCSTIRRRQPRRRRPRASTRLGGAARPGRTSRSSSRTPDPPRQPAPRQSAGEVDTPQSCGFESRAESASVPPAASRGIVQPPHPPADRNRPSGQTGTRSSDAQPAPRRRQRFGHRPGGHRSGVSRESAGDTHGPAVSR